MTILKMTEPARERDIGVQALKEAICLKCANCYVAMSFANVLGGTPSDAWYLCHAYPLKALLAEARERGLDLSGLKAAVDGIPIEQSLYYKRATGAMTEDEFQAAFREWQKGG